MYQGVGVPVTENYPGERTDEADPIALKSAVLCEQVRILYQSPAVILVNLVNAVLVAYLLRYFYPRWLLLAWVGSFLAVVSTRLYDSWRYRRKPQSAGTASAWAQRFTIGAIASGCLWGPIASILFVTQDSAYHVFVAFVVGGMAAGSVLNNSAYLPAMIGFSAPAVLPTFVAFIARPSLMSITMGLMVAAFTLVLGMLGRRANRWITDLARREIIQAALTAELQKEVAERKRAEAEMVRVMHTDPLTGLPNRTAFIDTLVDAFTAAKRGAGPFAVLYIDIDRFKDVNETLGHSIGDELLKAVARRIARALHGTMLLSRVGGDEFGVYIPEFISDDVTGELAGEIIRSMAKSFFVEGSELHVSASIGISAYKDEMTEPEEMMRRADLALYEAKESGRNRYNFRSEENDLFVRERVKLAGEIKTALERREFELCYQPQVEAPSGRIIGVEALLRWNHPERGQVSPGAFIPVAEKTGAMLQLGEWVMSEVFRQLRLWHIEGINPSITCFNVSAVQFVSPADFERNLLIELSAGALGPGLIELELTETVLMASTLAHKDMLNRLRALGVRMAIDDFGTGYSSLEYLRIHSANRIKIAQEFVEGLPDDQGSGAIVRATIALAREFGIEIIAEGVETPGQLDFLVKAGCNRIQGFYFSRPVPADQAGNLLRQGVLLPATGGAVEASYEHGPHA
jgi:diguanylate cyclase (GGDEF)-like protein